MLAVAQFAGAQSFPRLKPLPPKKDATVLKATRPSPRLAVATPDEPTSASRLFRLRPWQSDSAHRRHRDAARQRLPGLVETDPRPVRQLREWNLDSVGLAAGRLQPLYHSSAVLPDGRVIIEGGEYNFLTPIWTRSRRHLRPASPTRGRWSRLLRFRGLGPFRKRSAMRKASFSSTERTCRPIAAPTDTALLDPKTLTWTPTG